jgi:hypothetical protein
MLKTSIMTPKVLNPLKPLRLTLHPDYDPSHTQGFFNGDYWGNIGLNGGGGGGLFYQTTLN